MGENTLSTAVQQVITSLTTAFTTSDLITIVTACVGAVAGYVVLWFGIRYVITRVRKGVFGGKLSA